MMLLFAKIAARRENRNIAEASRKSLGTVETL